jgi:hypothetical protein
MGSTAYTAYPVSTLLCHRNRRPVKIETISGNLPGTVRLPGKDIQKFPDKTQGRTICIGIPDFSIAAMSASVSFLGVLTHERVTDVRIRIDPNNVEKIHFLIF